MQVPAEAQLHPAMQLDTAQSTDTQIQPGSSDSALQVSADQNGDVRQEQLVATTTTTTTTTTTSQLIRETTIADVPDAVPSSTVHQFLNAPSTEDSNGFEAHETIVPLDPATLAALKAAEASGEPFSWQLRLHHSKLPVPLGPSLLLLTLAVSLGITLSVAAAVAAMKLLKQLRNKRQRPPTLHALLGSDCSWQYASIPQVAVQ